MRHFPKFQLVVSAIVFICVGATIPAFGQTEAAPTPTNRSFCEQPDDLRVRMIDEAERKVFTVRRLEFTGNTYTGDRELRRRMVLLQEGDIFEKKNLETAPKRLSRMKTIYPVTKVDIKVFLDRKTKDVDFVVCIRQKPRKQSK